MAMDDLTLEDVLHRAHYRAIPARKAIRLLQSRIQSSGLSNDHAGQRVGDALLAQSIQATPSALSLAYLSEALRTGILNSQALAIQLLFRLDDSPSLSTACLVSLSSTLLGTQWGSNTTLPLPAVLSDPRRLYPPDVGTSASATAEDVIGKPTLQLLLPLLRLCASPSEPPPLPITALVIRLSSSLEPYPAPPLEVGLEASGLLPQLSEAVGIPLRNCLSGLMTDLAISSTAAALSIGATAGPARTAGQGSDDPLDCPPLPPTFPAERPNPPIPLPHMISFILSYALSPGARSAPAGVAQPSASVPQAHHLIILQAGRYLASPEAFLSNLIEGSLQLAMGTHQTFTPELQRSLLFNTEWLPGLLRYWKDTSSAEWAYPDTLSDHLSAAFDALAANLTSLNGWISSTLAARLSEAENSDDGSSFSMVEGWEVTTVQACLVRRLRDLQLLSEEAETILLAGTPATRGSNGESMLDRISSGSRSSLPVYEALIAASPGAARSLAAEFATVHQPSSSAQITADQKTLAASQQIPLPDNLLLDLSSHPSLIMALSCGSAPEQLLHTCVQHLLDAPIDEIARADDLQGVLTRYGEGLVFVEALVDVFDLELPPLLARSRRAISLGHLDEPQKACLNGWVKALFSTEGIDDHILLSTTPRGLCWLAPSIIHQAIAATAAGRLDRDALHGGLSYFSQPLLSWCLGGIVAWLCTEVIRNGLISALYLDVLQFIVLSESTPEVLLRVNGGAIMRLLDPQAGLAAVFQSANFDGQAVRARLDSIPSAGRPWLPTPNTSLPLNVFRSQLHVIRHLAMTQHPWSGPFLADFQDCLSSVGPIPMLDVLYTELVRPTLEFDRINGDPLVYFAPLLCALSIDGERPLVDDLVSTFLPRLIEGLESTSDPADVYQLCGAVKSSLLLLAQLESSSPGSGRADRLVSMLAEILDGTREGALESRANQRKRRKLELGNKVSGSKRNAMTEMVKKGLRSDDELLERWLGVLQQ